MSVQVAGHNKRNKNTMEVDATHAGAATQYEADLGPPVAPRRTPVTKWAVRLGAIAIFLIAWQLYAGSVNPILLAPPSRIAREAGTLIGNGQLLSSLLVSLESLAIGFAGGFIAGVALGLVWARYRVVDWTIQPFVSAFWSTPLIALVPIYVLWFGFGLLCQILIIGSFTFFPILLNTYQGASSVDGTLVDVAKAYGCNNRETWRHVTIPFCVPYILAGMNVAVGHALTGMVIAEFYTNATGLGGIVLKSTNTFRTAQAFVPILVLMGIGIAAMASTNAIKRNFAKWATTGTTR